MATILTYEELFQIYRNEKSSNALFALPDEFDASLSTLLVSLSQKSSEDMNSQKELENAKRTAIGLIVLRRQKMLLRSFAGDKSKVEGLVERERRFFDKIKIICDEEDGWINSVVSVKKPESETNGGNKKRVRIIGEIPAYKGADLKEYGPFSIGEVVEVPPSEAEWLIKGNLGQETNLPLTPPRNGNTIYVTREIKLIKVKTDMDIPGYSNHGQSYGPYKTGQEIMLPEEEARFLERGSLAHEVRD